MTARPASLASIERGLLAAWTDIAATEAERGCATYVSGVAFGDARWNEELVLERYELLYEAGLVAEARRDAAVAGRGDMPATAWRWRPTTAASSRPRSGGCAARSNTARSYSS